MPGRIVKLTWVWLRSTPPARLCAVVPRVDREIGYVSASMRVAELVIDCHVREGCQGKWSGKQTQYSHEEHLDYLNAQLVGSNFEGFRTG